MVFSAALCMLEGLILIAFGLGRLSPERLLALYNSLLAAPKALTTISGIGLFFLLLGFILLIISSKAKPAPQMIEVQKDGKTLNVPQKAIKDFILQILEQNRCASDISVDFECKGKEVEIQIAIALDGSASIYQGLNQIEEVLKAELERVFEWKAFKFNFQLRGVGVDARKKYFSNAGTEQPQEAQEAEANSEDADAQIATEDNESPAKSKTKGKSKSKYDSLLSKMLWGK